MQRIQTNQEGTSARPMAAAAGAPVFGVWFYWWRSPMTVCSAGRKPA